MGFKGITVNTPASEPAHILAEDDAALYGGLVGGDCVLDIGNKMNATVITNNKVRVSDGVVCVGGHIGRITKGDYEDMTIANGVSGKKRYDIIAARFQTTGPGGTDAFKLVTIQGASGSTATDPAIVRGDLYNGDKQRDYGLWRVCLDGLSIVRVDKLYEIADTHKSLSNSIDSLNSKLASVAYDKTAVNFKEAWEARYCRCEKTGKIVHFNARIYTGTIMKNNRYIISATCNPAIKPAIDSNLTAVAGDYSFNDTVACQCCYLSDGTIELRVPADGKVYVNINGSYVTV